MSSSRRIAYWVEVEESERTGLTLKEAWKNAQGKLHRIDRDQPAFRRYDEGTGIEEITIWYRDGDFHRDSDKPAFVLHDPTSGLITQESWFMHGVNRRVNSQLPVSIEYNTATGEISALEFLNRQGDIRRTQSAKAIQAYVKSL